MGWVGQLGAGGFAGLARAVIANLKLAGGGRSLGVLLSGCWKLPSAAAASFLGSGSQVVTLTWPLKPPPQFLTWSLEMEV